MEIWIGEWEPLILCSLSLIQPSLTNRNSSSTIVWPDRFNIPCPQCLQCQPFMTNLELDGIELILTITSKIISKQMKWVMWYNTKKTTTPQRFEADHIQLMTMRNIKAFCSKSNERSFVIQCVMNEYEEGNATIWARHPKLFKDDTSKFEASKELVMCMPFDFINGLKDKRWTCIDHKWLARLIKHLKKAQSSNIKQIRFVRHIGRLDIYDNSRYYEIEDDCHIYEIFLENNITHYVNFSQINDSYREKSIACALLHHLKSSLFLGEQRRRNPRFLMLYAFV